MCHDGDMSSEPVKKPRWDAGKSVRLSIVVTWVGMVAVVACVPFVACLPAIVRHNPSFGFIVATPLSNGEWTWFFITTYACIVAGFAALILFWRMLTDISHDQVFTTANVKRLRLISWCGFAIAILCVVTSIVVPQLRALAVLVVFVAVFMGLLVRVIKNVIDAARILKEDADYTI